MATIFLDDTNREWKIHLTLGKVKQINEKIGLDLLAPWDGKAIGAVTKDVFRFAEILALSVEFINAEDGEALANGLRGEALDRAILAFWQDLSCFFVGAQRLAFQTLIAKTFETWDAIWMEGMRGMSQTSRENLLLIANTSDVAPTASTNPPTTGS